MGDGRLGGAPGLAHRVPVPRGVRAHRAAERKTGARGLRAVLEKAMTDLLFELPREDVKDIRFEAEHIDEPLKALESKGLKKSA